MQCLVCESSGRKVVFSDGEPICKSCVTKLIKIYGVEYSPPTKQSKITACLSLIEAIRLRAEAENDIAAFEANWLNATPWNQIFSMIYQEARKFDGLKDSMELFENDVL